MIYYNIVSFEWRGRKWCATRDGWREGLKNAKIGAKRCVNGSCTSRCLTRYNEIPIAVKKCALLRQETWATKLSRKINVIQI